MPNEAAVGYLCKCWFWDKIQNFQPFTYDSEFFEPMDGLGDPWATWN